MVSSPSDGGQSRRMKSYTPSRTGSIAFLSLDSRENWRHQLDLGSREVDRRRHGVEALNGGRHDRELDRRPRRPRRHTR